MLLVSRRSVEEIARIGLLLSLLALPAAPSLAGGAASSRQYVTGQAAAAVVGQKNFSDNVPGAAASEMGTVSGLTVAGDRLIVCDGGLPFAVPNNNRILLFDSLSELRMGASASVVIGQPEFGKNEPGLSEKSLNRPVGIHSDGQRLAVADAGNNRVLIFNRIPAASGAAADVVVGQGDFKSGAPDTNAGRLRGPTGVFLDGRRLFVADTLNHRVLIFNSIPTSNGARADVVLGQADFNGRADQPPTNSSLRDPTSVFSDGVRLIVTDLGHNRVLIYSRIPTSNNAAADVVVGQPDFTKDASGSGRGGLNFPRYAFTDGTRLFIADTGNNRVLVYNELPTSNGELADAVLGQKDFQSSNDPQADDPERLTAGVLALPVALAASDSSVLVADSIHRRVLKFVPGVPLFHPGAVLSAANFGGNGLSRPGGVQVEAQPEGDLRAGDYYIKVTAEGGILFESQPSEEVAVTVPDNSKLVVTFDEVPGATKYRAYIGGSPGGQSRYFPTPMAEAEKPIERRVEISSLTARDLGGPRLEVTPGSIAALFGRDLAPQVAVAGEIPLPRELAGVSVLVNGVLAPLFFASPTQINFQVPWETTGTSASVMIQKRSPSGELTLSTAVPAGVNDLTPGVFTVSGDGVGRLLAFHADFTPVNDKNPIEAGEEIVFFGTGVQKVKAPVATGEASPDDAQIDTTMSLSIQGRDAPILFAGLAPGFVGLFQFNVKVAEDLELNGEDTEVKLFVGSIPANLTYLPVKNGQSGQITVTREGLVTWTTTAVAGARVFVSVDDGEEVALAEGASGSVTVDFIAPGHVYRFILRKLINNVVGDILATATLDTRG